MGPQDFPLNFKRAVQLPRPRVDEYHNHPPSFFFSTITFTNLSTALLLRFPLPMTFQVGNITTHIWSYNWSSHVSLCLQYGVVEVLSYNTFACFSCSIKSKALHFIIYLFIIFVTFQSMHGAGFFSYYFVLFVLV